MKLSVNILTWNNIKTLHDILHVLKEELKDIDSEVIIVDNGSTDGCQDFATIKNPTNLGISVGKNQGFDASQGEYLMLLDGDVVPVPNSIRLFVDYLDNHSECDAIGFMPNKFSIVKNREGLSEHESYCHTLFNPRIVNVTCLFYGIYRREVMDKCRMTIDGEMGKAGYGWEDHDFYMQMKSNGFDQWQCGVNHECGKYYHLINSSIRNMGYDEYIASSKRRGEHFNEKWKECLTK